MRTNVVGTSALLEAARLAWLGPPSDRATAPAFPPCLDRRGLRRAGRGRACLHRGERVCPELAVRRVQGRLRPPGQGVSPHLRPARGDQQQRQQLRPAPEPREADSDRDRGLPRARADPDLRRRLAPARLAVRRGSLPRPRCDPARRAHRGDLHRRRGRGAGEPGAGAAHLRDLRSNAAAACAARAPDRLRARPSRARLALCGRVGEAQPGAGVAPQESLETGLRKTIEWFLARLDRSLPAER